MWGIRWKVTENDPKNAPLMGGRTGGWVLQDVTVRWNIKVGKKAFTPALLDNLTRETPLHQYPKKSPPKYQYMHYVEAFPITRTTEGGQTVGRDFKYGSLMPTAEEKKKGITVDQKKKPWEDDGVVLPDNEYLPDFKWNDLYGMTSTRDRQGNRVESKGWVEWDGKATYYNLKP